MLLSLLTFPTTGIDLEGQNGVSNHEELNEKLKDLEHKHQIISEKLKEWRENHKLSITSELQNILESEVNDDTRGKIVPDLNVDGSIVTKDHSTSLSQETNAKFSTMDPSVLVVGGTDGSGTRFILLIDQEV